MGGVEPWLMARWKAHVEFLLNVIELLFLYLTVEALQGKRCQDSLLSGGGRSVQAKISGGRGRPRGMFLVSTKLDTFCYPTVQTSPCYVPSFWHNTDVWRTEGQTDGIAVASTALAKRRAVKMKWFRLHFRMFHWENNKIHAHVT